MAANPADVAGVPTASLQVCLVGVERLGHAQGLRGAGARVVAPDGPRLLLCLPETKDHCAIGFIEVVGRNDALRPIGTQSIGETGNPSPCGAVQVISARY